MRPAQKLHAARYLKALATIETLSALGNDDEVRRLLAGIDPLRARELAAELEDSPLILSVHRGELSTGHHGSPRSLARCG